MNQTPGSAKITALDYLQYNGNNDPIVAAQTFLKGSGVATPAVADGPWPYMANNTPPDDTPNRQYTMVDLSAWDLASMCGSCHPGGGFVEKDRNGKRFSQYDGSEGMTPYNTTVWEKFDPQTGLPQHEVIGAAWSYPLTMNGQPVTAPGGWGRSNMNVHLPDGTPVPVVDKQVMMPNVKEFDCLICHEKGYSNLLNSMMTYSAAFNGGPSLASGFMNMFTQAYDFSTGLIQKDDNGIVSLTPAFFSNMMSKKPATQNCKNCHMGSKLVDIPDMMRDFLSSAPMTYTGSFAQSPTGLAMPAYDFNAPFGMTWNWTGGPYATSPSYYMTQYGVVNGSPILGPAAVDPAYQNAAAIPSRWPSAMGRTVYNQAAFNAFSTAMPGMKQYFMGGGNPPMTGPLYYAAPIAGGMQDQNALKKGIVPFPRADWFKRGDAWADGYDVHLDLECAGCHMQTNTAKVTAFVNATSSTNTKTTFDGKGMCDPGRGFDVVSATEGSPDPIRRATVNSQRTVKMCADCHVTGKNSDGVAIDTFGAPNPTAAHQAAGLLKNVTQAIKTTDGSNEVAFTGSHLDVMDCTVCHIYRKQMVVRLLDSTSGHRYPNMRGIRDEYGMMGMFSNPAPGMIPADSNEVQWYPVFTWQVFGNYWKINDDGSVNTNWRRKLYPINFITAEDWNNVDPTVDANGDGVYGSPPIHHNADSPGTVSQQMDPWISRDLKAGLNFGPSGFDPIPVGFGGGQFQTAYDASGNFTGAWKYVGLYGGNIQFGTPAEITGYKAYREGIKGMVDGKSWKGTQLGFFGAPFSLTHGVRPVSTFVLGTSCTDCHSAAPKAPFFTGGFDMLGSAINTAKAKSAGQNLFSAPAEQMTVIGAKDDVMTSAELFTKGGYIKEVEFEQFGNCDVNGNGSDFVANTNGNCKKVIDLDRTDALYPLQDAVTYTDVSGTPYVNRAAWVNYLTNPAAIKSKFDALP